MGNIKEEAQTYTAPTTMNIADLDKVAIDIELKDGEGKDKEGAVFKYKYIEVNDVQYRVPGSVLGGIKAVLSKVPNLKFFSVIKQGEGLSTRYQVIPITDTVQEEKVE